MARPNKYGFSRVSVREPEKAGNVFYADFTHPLTKARTCRTIGTADPTAAIERCKLLDALLACPDHWADPPLSVYTEPVVTCFKGKRAKAGATLPPVDSGTFKRVDDTDRVFGDDQHTGLELELEAKLKDAMATIAILEAKLKEKDGLLAEVGIKAANIQSLPLEAAIKAFLKEGQAGNDVYTQLYESDLNAFAESIGKTTHCTKVTWQQVWDYIVNKKVGALRIEQLCNRISKFLVWGTGGYFKREPLIDKRRQYCKTLPKPKKTQWLTDDEANRLINALPKEWQGAAYLQWTLGLRPAELARLLTKNLIIKDGKGSCEICPIQAGRFGYWEPKNHPAGSATLDLPEWSIERLQPLTKTKTELLFTDNGEVWNIKELKGKKNGKTFSRRYCAAITAAAKKENITLPDRDKSIWLRSACARRLVEQKCAEGEYGNAIAFAAHILRDDEDTVKESYASLVKIPRKQD